MCSCCRIGTIVPSFIFSQEIHNFLHILYIVRLSTSVIQPSDQTEAIHTIIQCQFFFSFAFCFQMFLYTLCRDIYVPPANITFVFICLRLPRRWCLTSVECTDSYILIVPLKKKKRKKERPAQNLQSFEENRIGQLAGILIGASVSYDLCSMCLIGGTGSLRSHSTWDPRRHMYEELSHYAPNRRCPPPPRMGSADGLSHRGW